MKLFSHILVNASADSVWKVLSDPNLMELWNPKCVRSNAGKGPFSIGFRYDASFKLGRTPEREAECIIEEYLPNEILTTKYSGSAFKRNGYARETYRLIPKRRGTRIDQIVDLTHSEIPFIIQLLVKIVRSVGYSAGRGSLDGIKELAEHEESHQSNPAG